MSTESGKTGIILSDDIADKTAEGREDRLYDAFDDVIEMSNLPCACPADTSEILAQAQPVEDLTICTGCQARSALNAVWNTSKLG